MNRKCFNSTKFSFLPDFPVSPILILSSFDQCCCCCCCCWLQRCCYCFLLRSPSFKLQNLLKDIFFARKMEIFSHFHSTGPKFVDFVDKRESKREMKVAAGRFGIKIAKPRCKQCDFDSNFSSFLLISPSVRMSSVRFCICRCFFSRNIFVPEWNEHVSFRDREQFREEHRGRRPGKG